MVHKVLSWLQEFVTLSRWTPNMFSKFLWKKHEGVFQGVSGNSYGLLRNIVTGWSRIKTVSLATPHHPWRFFFEVRNNLQDPQLGNQSIKFTLDRKCWIAKAHNKNKFFIVWPQHTSASVLLHLPNFKGILRRKQVRIWTGAHMILPDVFPVLVRHCSGSVLTWGRCRAALHYQQGWYCCQQGCLAFHALSQSSAGA